MPRLYQSGEFIPGLDGAIVGGTTILIDHPREIRALQVLCSVAQSSPEEASTTKSPLEGVYQFLNAPFLHLESWFQVFSAQNAPLTTNTPFPHWQNSSTHPQDEKDALLAGLSLAYEVWTQQGEFGTNAGFCLTMSIGDATATSQPMLVYEGAHTGLLLTQGSITATFLQFQRERQKFVSQVAGFGIALFRRKGFAATTISSNLVEDMRAEARKQSLDLLRLDNLSDFAEKKAVIVFLHGLLSTDCGTFDTLINAWKRVQEGDRHAIASSKNTLYNVKEAEELLRKTLEDVLLVGWPHDTLQSIDDNGFDLFRLLECLAGNTRGPKPHLAFVCHSRGGLVARSAAVKLFQKDAAWQKKVRGCVTFGTQHEGAMLAEMRGHADCCVKASRKRETRKARLIR